MVAAVSEAKVLEGGRVDPSSSSVYRSNTRLGEGARRSVRRTGGLTPSSEGVCALYSMSSAPRRPAPKRPIGGGSLLDNILSKTTKLHSSVRNTRVGDDTNEVATPYMMSRSACAPSSLVVCRMPECTPPGQSAVFDIDMRHGDRVCVRCGTVQNSRSIESQEEEHRTFADDDKAESKKRAEINDGKQGGRTGDKSLGAAMGIANAEPGKVTLTLPLTWWWN